MAKDNCPPHYWVIDSNNVGTCKKCNEVRDFGKMLRKCQSEEIEVRIERRKIGSKSRPRKVKYV